MMSLSSAYRWLVNRPSYLLLTADEDRLAARRPGAFARSGPGLMVGAVLWGSGLAWLWGAAWRLYGDIGTSELAMPAMVTAVVLVLWPMRRAAGALVKIAFGRNPSVRAVGAAAVVVVLFVAFYRLRADWSRAEWSLWPVLAWTRPQCKIYRVLVLMPVWGAWSMLATCQFRRPSAATEPAVAALARGCGAAQAAVWMAAVLAMTIGYYGYLGQGAQLMIPAATIAAAIGGGLVLAYAAGGLCRKALLAVNVLTAAVHVLVFLVFQ